MLPRMSDLALIFAQHRRGAGDEPEDLSAALDGIITQARVAWPNLGLEDARHRPGWTD